MADPGVADVEQSRWRCVTCQHTGWDWDDEQYRCRQCGSTRFFDTSRPFRVDMADGIWVFEPRTPDQSPGSSPQSFDRSAAGRDEAPHHTTGRSPPEPNDDGHWNEGEYAESERLTNDPTVDPDASDFGGRRRRRRRRASSEQKTTTPTTSSPNQQVGMTDLVNVMKQLVGDRQNKHDTSSVASWNSRRGPEPGMKWRGGTPPSPPLWKYSSSDLRAFSRWEKKIRIWQLQVRNYVSASDAALMLFTSLTGEAEQEVEHIDLTKVNTKDGVDYLLDALRGPLQQKELFQKRKLLADYENVSRMSHESIRQYINRYRRIEKDLESIGISSSTMYDSESRGNRILERDKLSPEFQRLVLELATHWILIWFARAYFFSFRISSQFLQCFPTILGRDLRIAVKVGDPHRAKAKGLRRHHPLLRHLQDLQWVGRPSPSHLGFADRRCEWAEWGWTQWWITNSRRRRRRWVSWPCWWAGTIWAGRCRWWWWGSIGRTEPGVDYCGDCRGPDGHTKETAIICSWQEIHWQKEHWGAEEKFFMFRLRPDGALGRRRCLLNLVKGQWQRWWKKFWQSSSWFLIILLLQQQAQESFCGYTAPESRSRW